MSWRFIIIAVLSVVFVSKVDAEHSSGGKGHFSGAGLGHETLGVVVNDDDPVSVLQGSCVLQNKAQNT